MNDPSSTVPTAFAPTPRERAAVIGGLAAALVFGLVTAVAIAEARDQVAIWTMIPWIGGLAVAGFGADNVRRRAGFAMSRIVSRASYGARGYLLVVVLGAAALVVSLVASAVALTD